MKKIKEFQNGKYSVYGFNNNDVRYVELRDRENKVKFYILRDKKNNTIKKEVFDNNTCWLLNEAWNVLIPVK